MTARLTTNTQTNAGGIVNYAQGQATADATTAADETFTVGFVPRYIQFVNATDRIMLEWYEGMAANSALRTVAAGTVTLDVASGIALGTAALGTAGTFTIKAADLPASKVCYWRAQG